MWTGRNKRKDSTSNDNGMGRPVHPVDKAKVGGGFPMEKKTKRSFGFLHKNERSGKPRRTGITEIRRPYYTPLGKRALLDILETMGAYVDIFKFSGGSFSLMPESAVRDLIDTRHSP